jgi:cytochrome b subunit of formate dehydrogenase/nitrate/TMAO reductase-like tetraheme cytochrome c subunit
MMRSLLAALSLLFAFAAGAEEPKLPADAENCLGCHDGKMAPAVDVATFMKSVHQTNDQMKVGCTDCHAGYSMGEEKVGHANELMLSDAEKATLAKLQAIRIPKALTSPAALLSCGNCHDKVAGALEKSVHSKWLGAATAAAPGPTCVACHGSPHAIVKLAAYAPKDGKREKVPADRREMHKRCAACHGNEEFAKAAGLSTEVVARYDDSIHGRTVRVGNEYAPVCTSCHSANQGGSHGIVAKADAASAVSDAQKKDTCGRCHAGATDNFAKLIAHKEPQSVSGHVVPHIVHMAFSWLTTLTLLFFAFHVLIDFIYELRMRLAKSHHAESADDLKTVVRFDIHQRAQHWFMLAGVIILGITGWPLRGAGAADAAGASKAFFKLFGGAEGAALWHRIGAVLIIISSLYHLFYLTFLAAQKRLPISMLPMPKDAADMKDNILFMLGVKKERPRFERYMYLEKFDYWAVFWGIIMMVGTGFVFWFPVFFAKYAPHWLIGATQIIHGEEATLAILFLFTVHFYNVHLKPSIFPMNWAWLNGRITVGMMKHEHPAEYERIKKDIK